MLGTYMSETLQIKQAYVPNLYVKTSQNLM
jgi:hypothetical protein